MASSATQNVEGQVAAGGDSLRHSNDAKVTDQELNPGRSLFQWLPEPGVSYMQASGAPTGTPFLGTVANIEGSMRRGWRVADLPGDTSDQN